MLFTLDAVLFQVLRNLVQLYHLFYLYIPLQWSFNQKRLFGRISQPFCLSVFKSLLLCFQLASPLFDEFRLLCIFLFKLHLLLEFLVKLFIDFVSLFLFLLLFWFLALFLLHLLSAFLDLLVEFGGWWGKYVDWWSILIKEFTLKSDATFPPFLLWSAPDSPVTVLKSSASFPSSLGKSWTILFPWFCSLYVSFPMQTQTVCVTLQSLEATWPLSRFEGVTDSCSLTGFFSPVSPGNPSTSLAEVLPCSDSPEPSSQFSRSCKFTSHPAFWANSPNRTKE